MHPHKVFGRSWKPRDNTTNIQQAIHKCVQILMLRLWALQCDKKKRAVVFSAMSIYQPTLQGTSWEDDVPFQ